MKRVFAAVSALTAAVTGLAFPASAEEEKQDDIVILYTNDVHCGIDDTIGYDGLALYKREMEAVHKNVVLADAGDSLQGGTAATLSKGAYITELMNFVGYDVAALGNHEFDYGIDVLKERAYELSCGYICCNFGDLSGNTMFDPYKIVDLGDTQVAFIGVTTPDTFMSSSPTVFQNENGEYIYSFCEKENELYERVQQTADEVRDKGADYVILLGHLGETSVYEKWSAPTIVKKTAGIDAVIDGHSHEVTPSLIVQNKNGENVTITQTGTKLANIGKMTITPDGISTELISSVPAPDASMIPDEATWSEADDREGRFIDTATNLKIHEIESKSAELLSKVIGHTDFELYDSDPATGERRVRCGETNLGDLCADMIRELYDTDVAFINGGGIRNNIPAGDITYGDLLNVFPYGNELCAARVTGQQLLDILENGVINYPEETGAFLSVSGIEYSIAENIPSGVKIDDHGIFLGVEGSYRVRNVRINGEPLELEKTYTAASINYLLKGGGDGYIISGKCDLYNDSGKLDLDGFIEYVTNDLGGVIPEKYRDPYGEGRISSVTVPENENENENGSGSGPAPRPDEHSPSAPSSSLTGAESFSTFPAAKRPSTIRNLPDGTAQGGDMTRNSSPQQTDTAPSPQSADDAAASANPDTGSGASVTVALLSLISVCLIAGKKTIR